MAAATRPPYLNVTLFTVRIDNQWRKLAGLSQPYCNETFGIAPVALGSDRVAYVEDCVNPRLPPNKLKRIKAFSFRTRGVRSLFPYGLPFPARGFALRPDGRRGVINDGTGLEEQLRWLQPGRLSAPIPLGLERVGAPAWSPDSRMIAVSGAVGLSQVDGVARSIALWRVYLAASALRRVKPFGRVVLEEDPALAWSPDSRLLAVSAQGREQAGKLLLLRRPDGKQLMLKRGHFGAVAWTSATTIAVVHVVGDGLQGGEYIELLDVRRAISQLRQS
jgi:hypothetical protein